MRLGALLRLRPFLHAQRRLLASGIAAFGLARVCEAGVPWFLQVGIDRIASGRTDLAGPVAGIVVAVLARYAIVTQARMRVREAGLRVAADLRTGLFEALTRQGLAFFNRHSVGDMMTRAIADIGLVQRLVSMGTILVVILVFATVVGFACMLAIAPSLTLLILPPMPVVVWYAWHSSRAMGVSSRAVQDRQSALGDLVHENLSGIRTIQVLVQEPHELARFDRANQAYADAFRAQARVNSLMSAWMPTLAAACAVTILGWGGVLVRRGELTIGELTAFFMYLNMVVQPFRVAGFIANLLQRAAVGCERLFAVLDAPPEVEDRPSGRTPAVARGALEVRGLVLGYPGDARGTAGPAVLDGIDLAIAPGERVAVMGRIGAGKTTLLRAMVRLLDPPAGTILLDGHDVRDYPLATLRERIALVPQDPFLFGEALRTNVSYDDPDRPEPEVRAAIEAADLGSTLARLPEQLDTRIGERGVTLSGGQKQRTTLARGLVRAAPVLLVDDGFSSVDTATEERILGELLAARPNLTTVLVTHRVSTARNADRIVVLERGRIVEQGSHAALLAAGGAYADLERHQRAETVAPAPVAAG